MKIFRNTTYTDIDINQSMHDAISLFFTVTAKMHKSAEELHMDLFWPDMTLYSVYMRADLSFVEIADELIGECVNAAV